MLVAVSLVVAILALWLAASAAFCYRLGIGPVQAFLYVPLKLLCSIDERGIVVARKAETPVVYVVWHQSQLEPALMLSLLPKDTLHILDAASAKSIWLEPWRELARTIAFNARHIYLNRRLVRHLKGNGRLAVYLPGDIEPDGRGFRLFQAVSRIANRADAKVVPIYVDGARHGPFSLTPREHAPRRLLPRLTITALEPMTVAELVARVGAERIAPSNAFFDRMAEARMAAADPSRTLLRAAREAAHRYGTRRVILEDTLGGRLTYRSLLAAARALAPSLRRETAPGEAVGLMLPNANAAVVAFMAVQSAGRVAAMINYSGGAANAASAIRTAGIKIVVTSRAFVQKAGLEEVVSEIENAGAKIRWLEELRQEVSPRERIAAAFLWRHPLVRAAADDPAVMLFTSGSEGVPKAVVLSHRNLLANVAQLDARIAFSPVDSVFNVLPVFHSFGLTGGTLLPLLSGIRTYLYPSPLHYKLVPESVRKVRPSILFGTDTFLSGYAKAAGDNDFASLRLVVAGAEPLRVETRSVWRERFGIEIMEGFGMTEAAPVIAVNSATHRRDGSVGRLLPGMRARLEPVEGLAEGGRLLVAGPNVMLGVMTSDRPGELQRRESEWHDTGDIVSFDRRGFMTVRGRARRFAKVGGEMVSLGAIEMMASALWPEEAHAVVAVPDRRRGERIVLVTTAEDADRTRLRQFGRKSGQPAIALPSDVVTVREIPVLGTGKTDYPKARDLAIETLKLKKAA